MKTNYVIETFGLQDKVVIITGGNTGLGQAYSDAMAQSGAKLFITCYDKTGVEEMQNLYDQNGWEVAFAFGDLTNPQIQDEIIAKCLKKYKRIDILVNNSGTISRNPILEGTDAEWNKVIDINMNVVYRLSREVSKIFKKQGGGKIINIASMLSFQGGKFVPSYTASKHGVAGLTKAFANELAEFNINVNAIAPGYIETKNTAPIRADVKRNSEILTRIPANRWGKPSDVAATCVFLASKASDYCNGFVFAVDGGWLAR
ncbi:short-chain-alcohol dehydrogenase [Spiroplasma clarkii]|uniref:2-deoxy-D-gluconate 3-dehydrogenase n=1 Tax=Spiroplasma clarkii TaxID=2139 RepID=A0A1Y0L1Z4_9MOLU|nr:2-dehydro-3-deoxy-D-gluconate 5-dehydrogenase KduD [Spiroplasma clarkii]ARU91800.1 short-chain-alcohol dehydrogenase [Spiroplasma clarkii]ATX71166.1 2-deoxy-D-gluconate 3-dehydrogenase [Spiroplasma clarkii]